MELSSCVSTTASQNTNRPALSVFATDASSDLPSQHYPSPVKDNTPVNLTKQTTITMNTTFPTNGMATMPVGLDSGSVSPLTASPSQAATPKTITFQLLFSETPGHRARLPLRVSIFPHDNTDSIVTTVKNFYGLYSSATVSKGVSFEDSHKNTLIARYENFQDEMIVYVRVIEESSPSSGPFSPNGAHSTPAGAQPSSNGDSYPLQAPQQLAQPVSRPTSRTSRLRSPSPNGGRGRRSTSVGTNTGSKKGRSRSSKTRVPGAQGIAVDGNGDSFNGYSSGDGASGSVSGKNKEQLGNTEISLENIVEGGRRKRAKFESSELPLFAPPQMPAATSNPSVSPARLIEHHRQSLPAVQPGQNPFSNPRPLQSPQMYNNGYVHSGMYSTPAVDDRRARNSFGYPTGSGVTPGAGMMPTPDPTVGSCMSEEDKDVAIQLMRLGTMSNISHGRTSASTLDETFSGIADAASSTGATSNAESDGEEEEYPARRQKLDAPGNHKKSFQTTESHFAAPQESVEASGDDADYEDGSMAAPRISNPKPKSSSLNGAKPRSQSSNKIKSSKPSKPKVKKAAPTTSAGPMTPASLPASRKQSLASNPTLPLVPGDDDQPDLSTKPRCQRCRKSKKGCDRQRPCGRCRDAGIPAEQCISEDEGNGRKGRYGRHMGVPVKTDGLTPTSLLPAAPIAPGANPSMAPSNTTLDKNKKRKR
ncbi:C6 finger domain-containing protein [Cercophora scortea]|uniref:C6 finger domain-containing protein n=1 Tax=Cercophora scortea TaxID=314031 RepID=A0AAE0MD32_9PEZI|nr:C6 finger domain-containing protein [Cercophora scortea]